MVRVLVTLAVCLVPMLDGAALTSSRRYEHSRQGPHRREHGQQLRVALIQKRRHLAGELHDVAAHRLAGIIMQAATLERLVDRDPQTAREATQQLHRQAKETLSRLRSAVGLLHSDKEAGESSPGSRDLSELVTSTRALGVDIGLLDGGLLGGKLGDGTTHGTSSGTPSRDTATRMPVLSQQTDTAVFRMVQQSISNALQRTPEAPVTMELRRTEGSLELIVLNGPTHRPSTDPGDGGTGLAVIQERVDTVGGSLHAGPVESGDQRVRLVLPLAREEDA